MQTTRRDFLLLSSTVLAQSLTKPEQAVIATVNQQLPENKALLKPVPGGFRFELPTDPTDSAKAENCREGINKMTISRSLQDATASVGGPAKS